ncbi:SMI1/KNR4 family protein [Streptomyces sp. 24-1644]|uniref:SMI1/KNR4 family protein n=1 Tax=Streptomyces sp. 24-1644 TaxID=3457315 RepID=UPI003FA7A82D
MTAYDGLLRLVTPPATPIDAHGDWTVVESELGRQLPNDYKWLVATYGWGEFCDFLYLRTPFGTREHNGITWQSGPLRGSSERDRERYPYPLHPAPGALLVWGTTMDADRLCWLTEGSPEEWSVVVWSSEGWYETHPMGAAEFIKGWARGQVSSSLLVDMEPDLAPWFTAFRPRVHRCLQLSDGPFAHRERLRLLRQALAPTTDRGAWWSEPDGTGQDHFATDGADWLFTYDASCPPQIRADFPPEDRERVRQRLFAAVELMRCEVLRITGAAGTPLPAWDAVADDEE